MRSCSSLASTLLAIIAALAQAPCVEAASALPSLALIPSRLITDSGRSLAEVLGLDRDALYLFDSDRPAGRKILDAGNTLLEWADLSPDCGLIAYKLTYPDPAKIAVVPQSQKSGVAIIDSGGVERGRIMGGGSSSWSPSGDRLAVLIPPRRDPWAPDSLIIWKRSTGEMAGYVVQGAATAGDPQQALAWLSPDTLLLGTHMFVPSSGQYVSSGHCGAMVSPDREYSLSGSHRDLGVWGDLSGFDATACVVQVCGAIRLRSVGKGLWLPWGASGHVLALETQEEGPGDGDPSRPASITSFIDVGTPELLAVVSGQPVGMSSDGTRLVLLRDDGLHFDRPGLNGKVPASRLHCGTGVGSHSSRVRIEMISIGWGKFGSTDTLGVKTVSVAPGAHIAADAPQYMHPSSDSTAFRVLGVRSNGSVLMESKSGLVPAAGWFRRGYRHRFIVTTSPISVGTASQDGGALFKLRVVTDSRR